MRYISLKKLTTSIPFIDKPTGQQLHNDDGPMFLTVSSKTQIVELMRTPADPRAGLDGVEMGKNLRVLQAILEPDKYLGHGTPPGGESLPLEDGDTLELEDADYEHLKGRVAKMRFPFADAAFVSFIEAINDPFLTRPLTLLPREITEGVS